MAFTDDYHRQRFQSLPRSDAGCWLWTGANQGGKGYGSTCYRGVHLASHRLAYQLFVGPIPEGLQLDHLCRVPACCNPEHLEPVTAAENQRRGLVNQNVPKQTCPEGHVYDRVMPGTGWRRCNVCFNRRRNQWRAERVAAGFRRS